MTPSRHLVRATAAERADWRRLRQALWPDAADHERDIDRILRTPEAAIAVLAYVGDTAIGFAEATRRVDHVNGCTSSPVAFLEGLYVGPAWRRGGVARSLVADIETWARAQGCRELGSDTLLANVTARMAHAALGFDETERVVFFRRTLDRG